MSKGSVYMQLVGKSTPFKHVQTHRAKRKNEAAKEAAKKKAHTGECIITYRKPCD